MTGSVTSKSTVSPTCAAAEETGRLRRRRTGVRSWRGSTWAAAARTRKKVPARRMINLSEAGRARGLPKHDPINALGFRNEASFHAAEPRRWNSPSVQSAVPAQTRAPETRGADIRRGGERRVELAVERVLPRDFRGQRAHQVLADDELRAGIARQAEYIQVVVELICVTAQPQGDKRAWALVGQLRGPLVLGNLRHAEPGDVARLHVQILQLAGKVAEAFTEFGFHTATDGRGGVGALPHDGGRRTGKRNVGDEVIERIAVSGDAKRPVLADPVHAGLASPECLRHEGRVGLGGGVARAKLAVEFVQRGSAEAAGPTAAGAQPLLASHESAVGTQEPAVLPGEAVPQSGEELNRPKRGIGLPVYAVLQLRSTADSLTAGHQMVRAGAFQAVGIRTSHDVPLLPVMLPKRGAADRLARDGLAESQAV